MNINQLREWREDACMYIEIARNYMRSSIEKETGDVKSQLEFLVSECDRLLNEAEEDEYGD